MTRPHRILPPIRIGFDVGGVVTDGAARHDPNLHWLDDEVGYLETPQNKGFIDMLASLVYRCDPEEDIYFVSKCNQDTARRTKEYLAHIGVYDLEIPEGNVHFTETRDGKAPIIHRLELDAFVDDRAEVHEHNRVYYESRGLAVPHSVLYKPDPHEAEEYGGDREGMVTFYRMQRLGEHLLDLEVPR